MSKYKVEMIVEVNEGHPRKWIPDAVSAGLEDGEDILEWSIEEIDDQEFSDLFGLTDVYGREVNDD